MHFQSSFTAALLAPVVLAGPGARVAANRRYGSGGGYGGGSGGGYGDSGWGGQPGSWQAGTSIANVQGTVAVPALKATVPLISATATVSNGKFAQASASVQAIGNGPGLCPQDPTRVSQFLDVPSGRRYNLFCGQEVSLGQDIFITKRLGVSWQTCLDICAGQPNLNCDTVVYSRLMWVCYIKHMGDLATPQLNNNTDRYMAYLPNALQASFTTQTLLFDKKLIGTPAPTTTKTIAAGGLITVSGDTAVGTVVSGTASISNSTTVGVNILMRWPG